MYQKERIKRRITVTASLDCDSILSGGGRLLRCPVKPLSHRAHQECGRWGKESAAGESHRLVVIISKRHTPKDSAQNKPEVLSPKTLSDSSLRSHIYSPFHNSCSDLVQRACCPSPETLSLPLQPVTTTFQVSADSSSFSQRDPSNTMNAAPVQAQPQPQRLGREGKKRSASNWYLRRGTHLMCTHTVAPKFPDRGNTSKCPFQLSHHPSSYTVLDYLLTLLNSSSPV